MLASVREIPVPSGVFFYLQWLIGCFDQRFPDFHLVGQRVLLEQA